MKHFDSYSEQNLTVLTDFEIEAVAGGQIPFLIGLVLAAGTGGGLAALALAVEDAVGYHNHYT